MRLLVHHHLRVRFPLQTLRSRLSDMVAICMWHAMAVRATLKALQER